MIIYKKEKYNVTVNITFLQDEIYLNIILINFEKNVFIVMHKCFDTHSKNTT